VAVHVYSGRRRDARAVVGADLVLLRRWSRDTDRPATYSGLYPADEDEVLPRVAVVLTGADETEFQRHWFGHAGSTAEKFNRFLDSRGPDDRAGLDLAGEPFRLVDCAAPGESAWRSYVRRGERLRPREAATEHYAHYSGREHLPAAFGGPGLRRTVAVLVIAAVAIFLVATLASRPAAALGVIPAFAWMAYLRRQDRVRPESPGVLARAALAGVIATAPIVVIEAVLSVAAPDTLSVAGAVFAAFVIAGIVEESGKALCVRSFRWNPEFDERFDGIVYAGWIGLGFAVVENVLYLAAAPTSGDYVATFLARSVLAVPNHAIWAGLSGYALVRKKFDGKGAGLADGLLPAILLHGLYDVGPFLALALAHHHRASSGTQAALSVGLPVAVTVTGMSMIRDRGRRALRADAAEAARFAAAQN
jgi:RsiW-degrading membrane proteinase PrsW (M82 family)